MMKPIIYILFLMACSCKNKHELSQPITPLDSGVTTLRVGQTIQFTESMVKGINRSEFPEPISTMTLDSHYFILHSSEHIDDPDEAGGIAYDQYIYKAIKKGETVIMRRYIFIKAETDTGVKSDSEVLQQFHFQVKE